jgi:hypothetical protein
LNPAEGLDPDASKKSKLNGFGGNGNGVKRGMGQQVADLHTNPMHTGESGNRQGSFVRTHSRSDRLGRIKSADAPPGGSVVAEKAKEEQGRAKDDIRNQMGSFIARGKGSFIAQEGRSSRQRKRTSKGKKKGTDATDAAAGGDGGGGGAGSGDDVISDGVESKRPELVIVQVDNETSCTGSADSHEGGVMAHPSESSRHTSIEV